MSKIQWTEQTWNPTTGCTKVSQGCKNCYAEVMHKRLNAMGLHKYSEPFRVVQTHQAELQKPYKWKKPRMIFVNSMSDLFHKDVPLEFIQKVFEVMSSLPRHTFQVLTKRHERLLEIHERLNWTENIWMGVSAEDQATADSRIPALLATNAKMKWVSFEPMIGAIQISDQTAYALNWAVLGGESGYKARPCKLEWLCTLSEVFVRRSTPVFIKQLGTVTAKEMKLSDKKGGDISEFPKQLAIRQYPK